MLHIPIQHLSHALLVYGWDSINTVSKYWTTLGGTYSALIVAAVGSTILNALLLERGMSKNAAFVSTLFLFAGFNYFFIGWIVKISNQREAAVDAGRANKRKKQDANKNNKSRNKSNNRGGWSSMILRGGGTQCQQKQLRFTEDRHHHPIGLSTASFLQTTQPALIREWVRTAGGSAIQINND